MKLVYKNKDIGVTFTHNEKIMRYKVQKLYFAYYIVDCKKYSSIMSKQEVDVVSVDKDDVIKGFVYNMHINTVFSARGGVNTIILPCGYFDNLQIGEKFSFK